MKERPVMEEQQAREEIVKWGKELYDRGLTSGSGGNLSIRIDDDTVLATPTGWSLGHLTAESITKTTIEGVVLSGPKPTKEMPMHLMAYKTRPDIAAVAHTHSAYATSYGCMTEPGTLMPPFVSSIVAKVGDVKVTPFCLAGSRELGEVVSEAIRDSQAVILANHGVLAVGGTLEAAVTAAYEVEDDAKIYFISGREARPLPAVMLAKIKPSFK